MDKNSEIARTIATLSTDLPPVRLISSPWRRAAAWLGIVSAAGLALSFVGDGRGLISRSMGAPDLWLAIIGSILTMILGAIAAFQLSVPDRSPRWAFLPIPGLALWIGASGLGCLRTWTAPEVSEISFAESESCFRFIILMSIPLSLLLMMMLRRAFTLHPHLATFTGGISVAAAAATLLNFFHPYDASATDLALHFAGVAIVIGLNQLASRFLPTRTPRRSADLVGSR